MVCLFVDLFWFWILFWFCSHRNSVSRFLLACVCSFLVLSTERLKKTTLTVILQVLVSWGFFLGSFFYYAFCVFTYLEVIYFMNQNHEREGAWER